MLCSSYRRQTLNSILTGTKTSREVADELGVRRQTITKAINELRNAGLVAADGREYSITKLFYGKIVGSGSNVSGTK